MVKAPSLLTVIFKLPELEQEFGVPVRTIRDGLAHGVPHRRDEMRHLWINSRDLAVWIEQQRSNRSLPAPAVDQGYCLRCRKMGTIRNPATLQPGKHALLWGKCPDGGGPAHCAGAVSKVLCGDLIWARGMECFPAVVCMTVLARDRCLRGINSAQHPHEFECSLEKVLRK
jgi:hypothetical protein